MSGKTVPGMVYVMNEGHELGAPSDFYLNTIMEGYKSAGFDTDFLDQAVEKSVRLAREQQETEPTQGSLFGPKWW